MDVKRDGDGELLSLFIHALSLQRRLLSSLLLLLSLLRRSLARIVNWILRRWRDSRPKRWWWSCRYGHAPGATATVERLVYIRLTARVVISVARFVSRRDGGGGGGGRSHNTVNVQMPVYRILQRPFTVREGSTSLGVTRARHRAKRSDVGVGEQGIGRFLTASTLGRHSTSPLDTRRRGRGGGKREQVR